MFELLIRSWPLLKTAIWVTVWLGLGAFVFGSILGMLIALMRNSTYRLLRFMAFMYVSVFRGTPLLVQLLLIYFGLPNYGIELGPITSSLIALSLFSAAYLSENFRSGINAVDVGQWEASFAMGMGYWKCLQRVILPQAMRVALPSVGGQLVALIKDTSLASIITVVEMTSVAQQMGAATFRYMEMFLIVGFIYWLINQCLTLVQTYIEGRLSRRIS
ncbi:cystine transport system permease protein [Pseudomonas sp. BT76 TE3572]|uniref:amino acid ABC transporter permease n=1 Tax=Pseudomonas sp. BT76 TE3572 TaxID=3349325 RepID=UPI003D1E1BE7